MKTRKSVLIIFIVLILVVLALQITGIFAWLTDTSDSEFDGETSELKVVYRIWFEKDGTEGFGTGDISAEDYYIGDDQTEDDLRVLLISTGNPEADNYIGKLRVQIIINTNGSYYARVKFAGEWFVERKTLPDGPIRYTTLNLETNPYGIADTWYYDSTSGYTYYKNAINASGTIDCINSPSLSNYTDKATTNQESKYYLHLDIDFEFVQANRMYAIWGFDTIPTGV
jgi:hypothetical protein